jgi:hypothetical protein
MMVNMAAGVKRRDNATLDQLQSGIQYAAEWLAKLQGNWLGVCAIMDAVPGVWARADEVRVSLDVPSASPG